MTIVTALDPGFGNTKVCHAGLTVSIQTAVSLPNAIGHAATGMKTGHVKTIQIDGTTYAVGQGAWLHGQPITSLDYTALASPERRALFFRALSELVEPGELTIDLLVVGLPVPLLQDRSQAEAAYAGLRSYKGAHQFTVGGKAAYIVNIVGVKVLAQPVGSHADWLIDSDLHLRKNWKTAENAVLDVGLNTLDLYALRGVEAEPRFVAGAKVGVRRLLAALNGAHDMEEIDADLRAGHLRATPEQLQSWLGEIMAVVERAWPSLSRFSSVIPTGGGALVLGNLLRSELARRGAAVAWPEDPITANVRGLWKWYARSHKDDKPAVITVEVAPAVVNAPLPPPKPEPAILVAVEPPARKRGRPSKAAIAAANVPLCTRCGKGLAKKDGICTTCWGKQRQAENTRRQAERIDMVVDMASRGASSQLSRIRKGETIGGARLG